MNRKITIRDEIKPPELEGNAGRLELGLVATPLANTPLTLEIGVQGYWANVKASPAAQS
jgi:hypothetical protein